MERHRGPPAHPARRRHLRGKGRRPHVALRRRPPHHARAAVEVLVRAGDAEAQGVRRLGRRAPMTEYREADFSRLKTVPIAQRSNKVDPSLLAHPRGREMNAAINEGALAGGGMGEALAAYLERRGSLAAPQASILLGAAQRSIPVTVHAAVGAEIIHQHPTADGAALGATSHRDFKRLAAALPDLDGGGVVLNLGSAVVMPEVFLKALTVARNLHAGRPTDFTACDCDMQRHYRPRVNVVERPTQQGGRGVMLTGHHEILFPLLCWGVLQRLDGH